MPKSGIKFANQTEFTGRTIAFDKNGVPWLIDPKEGTVSLAKLIIDDKQSAVKRK